MRQRIVISYRFLREATGRDRRVLKIINDSKYNEYEKEGAWNNQAPSLCLFCVICVNGYLHFNNHA